MWKIETKNSIFNARNSEEHTTKYVYSGDRLTSNCLNERFVWCMQSICVFISVCLSGCVTIRIDKRFVNNSPFECCIVVSAQPDLVYIVHCIYCITYASPIPDAKFVLLFALNRMHYLFISSFDNNFTIPTKGQQQSKGKHICLSGFEAFHTCCRMPRYTLNGEKEK